MNHSRKPVAEGMLEVTFTVIHLMYKNFNSILLITKYSYNLSVLSIGIPIYFGSKFNHISGTCILLE